MCGSENLYNGMFFPWESGLLEQVGAVLKELHLTMNEHHVLSCVTLSGGQDNPKRGRLSRAGRREAEVQHGNTMSR